METTGPSSDVKGGREIQSSDKGQENIKSYAWARQGASSPGEGAGQGRRVAPGADTSGWTNVATS